MLNTYTVHGPHESSIVERVQKTIKACMFHYFTYKNCYKYKNILDHMASAYNVNVHKTLNNNNTLSIFLLLNNTI